MKLKVKNIYVLLTGIYCLLTILELIKYFINDSSLFGLLYLIICMIVIFFITTTTMNYDKGNKKKRISKIFIAIILGLFASFALSPIIESSLSYEIINSFSNKNKLTIHIIKPIIYMLFLITSLYEAKTLKNASKKVKISVKTLKNKLKTSKRK